MIWVIQPFKVTCKLLLVLEAMLGTWNKFAYGEWRMEAASGRLAGLEGVLSTWGLSIWGWESQGAKNILVRTERVRRVQPHAWGKWLGFSSMGAVI